MQQSSSFNDVIIYAQEFAAGRGQNIVDVTTIALGVLETDHPFAAIFGPEDKEALVAQLIKKTEELGTRTLETEDVPLTMRAGLLINFTGQYALEAGDGEVDVYHLVLAMLSYPNDAATLLGRRGWIFDNYLAEVNKIVSPPLDVQKLTPALAPSVTQPYPKLRKKFWAEDYKRGIAMKLVEEARRHATLGKYDTCVPLCDVALDITQEDITPNRLIIYSLLSLRKFEDAIKRYEEWGIDDENLRRNIGACYHEAGRYDDALEAYNAVSTVNAGLHNAKGFTLTAMGRIDEALQELDAAIALEADYAYAYNNKGHALLKAGRTADAKQQIAHSLELDKGNAYAYRNMALVNMAENDKEAAKENIDKALFYGYKEKYGDDIDEIMG